MVLFDSLAIINTLGGHAAAHSNVSVLVANIISICDYFRPCHVLPT